MSRGGGLHVSEDRRISRREDEKRKRETGTPFHIMGAGGRGVGQPDKKLLIFPHLEKSLPSHMEKIPQ